MRLLCSNEPGDLSFKDFKDRIPPYAVLSHTWGSEEVSFEDVVSKSGREKAGFKKILFCKEQAARDGLQYFWVDTCCIDKRSLVEVSKAINTMFRWYRDAAKCYVHLSDVSTLQDSVTDTLSKAAWGSQFRRSRWFTRGWTLQELLAPTYVEFFSVQGLRLGDKKSLEQQIHEITGIPVAALHNHPLDEFSILERVTWASKRQTTEEEDEAYCLLGIFGVTMPLVYGEGRVKALKRLETEYNTENSSLSRAFPSEKYLSITALRDNDSEKHLKRQLTLPNPPGDKNVLKRQKVHGNQGFELAYNSGFEDDIGRAYPDQNDSWSAKSSRAFSYNDYTAGWICALPLEMAAATAVLDEVHPKLDTRLNDDNAYTLGCVCGHNVVIACLPSGVCGTTSTTVTASEILSSFSSIITWFLVGIGGGVPSQKHDIRLGDVVVSVPTPGCPAVVQYDYGKTVTSGNFEQTGNLNKPASSLLTAIAKLRAEHDLRASQIPTIMSKVFAKYPLMDRNYAHPGQNRDVLFQPGCDHVEEDQTCLPDSVARPPRSDVNPRIHYGPIASGNQVMKHSKTRDKIAQQRGILCFEMEAAGLIDKFSCLVIRGICDYCDAQEHKDFQNHAALTAAAYAKELLSIIPTRDTTPSLILQNPDSKLNVEHWRLMMKSLNFD